MTVTLLTIAFLISTSITVAPHSVTASKSDPGDATTSRYLRPHRPASQHASSRNGWLDHLTARHGQQRLPVEQEQPQQSRSNDLNERSTTTDDMTTAADGLQEEAKRTMIDANMCRVICSFCHGELSMRVSTLCPSQCVEHGKEFILCLTWWNIRQA